ncbi:DNA repair protein [Pseudooceanicola sp.]|uniref:DNA repair protein n=1 Tax=Pseudooceanicola sp. TaxID=1914328 RepID=UPI004059096C
MALGLSALVALSAFGVTPWPDLPLAWDGQPVPDAGMWGLIALTVLFVSLCAFIPMSSRVMALESAHRDFRISMHDVAHAYYTAHAADRAGTFRLSAEFDAVRERLAFLRQHPDLGQLEPEILEAAAQMSQVSKELAETYSDEKVDRARTFLKQRQEELEQFNDRIETAKALTRDLRHWVDAVDLEESIARSQLDRLTAELNDIMPELNLGVSAALQKEAGGAQNVVGLNTKSAAE